MHCQVWESNWSQCDVSLGDDVEGDQALVGSEKDKPGTSAYVISLGIQLSNLVREIPSN